MAAPGLLGRKIGQADRAGVTIHGEGGGDGSGGGHAHGGSPWLNTSAHATRTACLAMAS